jgi:hypothetical protein
MSGALIVPIRKYAPNLQAYCSEYGKASSMMRLFIIRKHVSLNTQVLPQVTSAQAAAALLDERHGGVQQQAADLGDLDG